MTRLIFRDYRAEFGGADLLASCLLIPAVIVAIVIVGVIA